jgi:hypothetical protein
MNKIIRNIAAGALLTTTVAVAGLAPVIANAADTKDQVVEASKAGSANPNLRLSQDGYNVMRDIRATRVAIFNGDTEGAMKYRRAGKGRPC